MAQNFLCNMKMIVKKRVIVLVVIGLIVLVIGAGFGYMKYVKIEEEKAHNLKIEKQLAAVQMSSQKVDKEADMTKKLNALKSLKADLEKYIQDEEGDKKVIQKYQIAIDKFIDFFIDQNKKILKDNTIEDLANETKEKISAKLEILNELLMLINEQKDVVYNKKDFEYISKQVNDLIKSYTNHLEAKNVEEEKLREEIVENGGTVNVDGTIIPSAANQASGNANNGQAHGGNNQANYQPPFFGEGNTSRPPVQTNDGGSTEYYWQSSPDGNSISNQWGTNHGDGSWSVGNFEGTMGEAGWTISQ